MKTCFALSLGFFEPVPNLVVEDLAAGAMEEQQSLQALEFFFMVHNQTLSIQ